MEFIFDLSKISIKKFIFTLCLFYTNYNFTERSYLDS